MSFGKMDCKNLPTGRVEQILQLFNSQRPLAKGVIGLELRHYL